MSLKFKLSTLFESLLAFVLLFSIILIGFNITAPAEKDKSAKFITDISNEAPFTTLVSYALYIPRQAVADPNLKKGYDICLENFNIFCERGLFHDVNVKFIFILIGDTQIPKSLELAVTKFSNLEYARAKYSTIDLFAQGDILEKYIAYDFIKYFLFLNCGSRGPYFLNSNVSKSKNWLQPFVSKFDASIKGVGATISCEISPHIQTYAVSFDRTGAKIVLPYWTPRNSTKSKLQLIRDAEVGASSALIYHGYNIASLESRHINRDFRAQDLVCDPEYTSLGNTMLVNPTRCDSTVSASGKKELATPGCEGLEPCEVVFVKYGGEVYVKDLVATQTKMRIVDEDSKWFNDRKVCDSVVVPSRPLLDIGGIFQNISSGEDSQLYILDLMSTLAIIVRAHSSYSRQLISLLWSLESQNLSYDGKILVLVLPTEFESIETLRNALSYDWPSERHSVMRVVLMDFPAWVYSQHGSVLSTLCSSRLRHLLDQTFPESDIRRHCNVNSPLHYLLVDIALYYVLNKCESCKQVLVTNADNHYSTTFWNTTLLEMESPRGSMRYDVVITNMISRGKVFPVKAERRHVDLGAYIVSTDFLRKTSISFLSALPHRAQANDYHDADGHFIDHLRESGARIKICSDYLFFHD